MPCRRTMQGVPAIQSSLFLQKKTTVENPHSRLNRVFVFFFMQCLSCSSAIVAFWNSAPLVCTAEEAVLNSEKPFLPMARLWHVSLLATLRKSSKLASFVDQVRVKRGE